MLSTGTLTRTFLHRYYGHVGHGRKYLGGFLLACHHDDVMMSAILKLACTRSCLEIDFSRTVNWYHLQSDSEHSNSLSQCGLRYWGQDSHSPTPPACYKQGIVFYIWESDLGRGCVLSMGCVVYPRGNTVIALA